MTEAARDEVYDRPIAYEDDDGSIVYRASSLGMCDGALVRARLGVTGALPSEFMQTRFDEGTAWETRVLEAGLAETDWFITQNRGILGQYGRAVEAADGLQVETEVAWGAEGARKVVRCHPDGILVNREDARQAVCEVKFLGESMYREKVAGLKKDGLRGLGPNYAWQAAIEMLSTGLPMVYVIGEKARGDDAVSLSGVEVFEYGLDELPYSLADVKMRVLQVEGYVARGEMPACPVPFMYPCPYWAEHDKVEKKPDIADEVLEHLVESYARAMSNKAAHEAEAASIKGEITDRLIVLHEDGGSCGGWEMAFVAARPGNVSWGKAYKALAKLSGKSVEEDAYRGAEVAGGLRMTRVKDDE